MCAFLYVVPTGNQDVDTALTLPMADFEDALQCAAAMAFQADCVVTRNTGDYRQAAVPAKTPEQFITENKLG